jgi:hypothetical protein
MPSSPIYEERLRANRWLLGGVSLWALAVGLAPGIILSGWWWLFALYVAFTAAIIFAFAQMRLQLFGDRLVVKFGFIYRQTIDVDKIQDCAPFKMEKPVRTYGGWGIRRGGDGSFALTQAFIREAVKLETVDQTFVISSQRGEDLCRAIKKARG